MSSVFRGNEPASRT